VQVLGVIAAACLAAATGVCCVDCAFAETEANSERNAHVLFFSGFDLWHHGGFLHGGVLWSPAGLDHEGFTLKLLFAGGQYGYQAGNTDITGRMALASVLPGWRFKGDRAEVTIFAGPDLQTHRLTPDDPGNRLRGSQAGLRIGGDIWYEPSPTMMATASASISTIGSNLWGRAAVGWRLLDRFWAGPEIEAFGDHSYQQLRIGVHATAFKTGRFEWSAGFGYAHDSDDRASLYGRIGLLTRR
jgi:hypothetical protein